MIKLLYTSHLSGIRLASGADLESVNVSDAASEGFSVSFVHGVRPPRLWIAWLVCRGLMHAGRVIGASVHPRFPMREGLVQLKRTGHGAWSGLSPGRTSWGVAIPARVKGRIPLAPRAFEAMMAGRYG